MNRPTRTKPKPRDLDHRATRFLARRAFDDGALDPVDWEFLTDFPERADEVLEFTRWVATTARPKGVL